jgi:hypothetical protein
MQWTKKVGLCIAATSFIEFLASECACDLVLRTWPDLGVMLGSTILCAIVNVVIAFAVADIPMTIALVWLVSPTIGGALVLGYLAGFNAWSELFGVLIGVAATPLFLPKAKQPRNPPSSERPVLS